MMYYYNNGFYPSSMWGIDSLLHIIFWVIVIVLIIKIIKHSKYSRRGDNAMNILKERYAKGEITKEQFELMKKDLS